jgi:hypothetical protein
LCPPFRLGGAKTRLPAREEVLIIAEEFARLRHPKVHFPPSCFGPGWEELVIAEEFVRLLHPDVHCMRRNQI